MVSTGQSRLAGLTLKLDIYVIEALVEAVAHGKSRLPGSVVVSRPTTHVSEPFTCCSPYTDSAATFRPSWHTSILLIIQQRCLIRISHRDGDNIDLKAMVGRGTDDNQFKFAQRNILLTGHARDRCSIR